MTRTKSAFLTLVAVLLAPIMANADVVTWEVTGVIIQVDGSGGGSGASTGDNFSILVTFDTDASLQQAQTGGRFGDGTRYEYDASGVSFLVSVDGQPDQSITPIAGGLNLLWLRDNSADRSCCEFDEVDGLTFALFDDEANGVSIILRGGILDLFTDGELPTDPDPRLVDLDIAVAQWSDDDGLTSGDITGIRRVPEPGTLALLGIGLAGMGFARRRKRA